MTQAPFRVIILLKQTHLKIESLSFLTFFILQSHSVFSIQSCLLHETDLSSYLSQCEIHQWTTETILSVLKFSN